MVEQLTSDNTKTAFKDNIIRQREKAAHAVNKFLTRPNIFNLRAVREELSLLGIQADAAINKYMTKNDDKWNLASFNEKYTNFFNDPFYPGDDLTSLKTRARELLQEYDKYLFLAEILKA